MPEPAFRLDPAACDQCGECVRACPLGAVELSGGFIAVDPDRCDGCLECALACPTVAIAPLGRKAIRRGRGQALPARQREGLKWRLTDLALALALLMVLQALLRFLPELRDPAGPARWVVIAVTVAFYVLILGAVSLIARRRGATLADLGIARFKVGRSLVMVVVLMAVVLFIRWQYVEIARLLGFTPPSVEERVLRLFGPGAAGFALAFFVTALLAPLVEELFFRGFVYRVIRERARPSSAVFLSALIFAIYHFSLWLVVPILLLGIALAWLTEWQRSIWPAVICHALNNFLAVASVYMLAR